MDYISTKDLYFNFTQFFKVYTKDDPFLPSQEHIGKFINQKDVKAFLDLLVGQYNLKETKNNTNYPFSTEEFREYFKHTLWMLPGVKEAKALADLLKKHEIFSLFEIINVAGDGDEKADRLEKKHLDNLNAHIGNDPSKTRTITLSCGRLTTGVTVRPWTGVFMLYGGQNTSAISYLQTIFRVQSPWQVNGFIKEQAYVFDFSPDRALKIVYDMASNKTANLLNNNRSNDKLVEENITKFLKFCPVIAIKGSIMKNADVKYILSEIKRSLINRVASNSFDDDRIFSKENIEFDLDLELITRIGNTISKSSIRNKPKTSIVINQNNISENETVNSLEIIKHPKTEEEKARNQRLKEIRNSKLVLRSIAVRFPLMFYGKDDYLDENFDLSNLTELIKDDFWEEFMPKGVTKQNFKEIKYYFDKTVFIGAGNNIR
ncbi:hypothetical protein [Mycoplasmopsis alligatoris]|uniref:Conserved domain protein n=1 Tax=Mycoplasmopsis alligatoris A21JP2 TaxID=747682 RepID=D4XVK0_9BACT|nr:hypothetical protein [Mycoplasmopsis alligatoris]EFF41696.1 conserved domain protein [Mycoplasmopsis alligatoris A21JP2]